MSKPIGAAGLALIKQFEGCRLTAYKPVPTEKYWTIGWGHYGPDVREGDRITQAEADAMLAEDCQRFADAVDDPGYVPLTDKLLAQTDHIGFRAALGKQEFVDQQYLHAWPFPYSARVCAVTSSQLY